MTDDGGTDRDQVRVRRAPKFPAFLFLGGVLGAVVALILTSSREVDQEVGFLQMLLFLGLFCVVGGMLLGGIAALVLERVYSRRSTVVDAERTHVVPAPVEEIPVDAVTPVEAVPADAPPAETGAAAAQAEQAPNSAQAPDADPRR